MPILPPDRLDEVVATLLAEGVVAIPTDTVYGLAALPTSIEAVRALADLKGREAQQPIAVLVDSVEAVAPHLIAPAALEAVARFWPGALTAIVKARLGDLVPPVISEAVTIGVRMPDDDLAPAVIRACGGVLAVTSANRHGEPAATSAEEVRAAFGDALVILDGGPRNSTAPSTVVDLLGARPKVLRAGPISAADLGAEE